MPYLKLIGNRWKTCSVAVTPLRRGRSSEAEGRRMEEAEGPKVLVYKMLSQGPKAFQAIRPEAQALGGSWRFKRLLKGCWYGSLHVPTSSNLPHVFRLVWRDLREGLSEPIYPFRRWWIPPENSSIEDVALTTPGGFGISKHHTMEWFYALIWIAFPIIMYRCQSKFALSPLKACLALDIVELAPSSITPLSHNPSIPTLGSVPSWHGERRHVSGHEVRFPRTIALAGSEAGILVKTANLFEPKAVKARSKAFRSSIVNAFGPHTPLSNHQALQTALVHDEAEGQSGLGWNRIHDRARYYSRDRGQLRKGRPHLALGWDLRPSVSLSARLARERSLAKAMWLRSRERSLDCSRQLQPWLQSLKSSGDQLLQRKPFAWKLWLPQVIFPTSTTRHTAQSLLSPTAHSLDRFEPRMKHTSPETSWNTLLALPSRQPRPLRDEADGHTSHHVASLPSTSDHLLPQVSQATQHILAKQHKAVKAAKLSHTRYAALSQGRRVTPWDAASLHAQDAATCADIWRAVRVATSKAVKDEQRTSVVTIPSAPLAALPIAITSRVTERVAKLSHLVLFEPLSTATVPVTARGRRFSQLRSKRRPYASTHATGHEVRPHKAQAVGSVASLMTKGTPEQSQPYGLAQFQPTSSKEGRSKQLPAAHLQPLALQQYLTSGNWLTRYVSLQVSPLVRHLDLSFTQPWWSLTAKRLQQAESMVSNLISHRVDDALGPLRYQERFGMQDSYLPQQAIEAEKRRSTSLTTLRPGSFGLNGLTRSAQMYWLSVVWVPCVAWLLVSSHGLSRLSGVAHLALWNDLERVRSTKHPSMLFDAWLKVAILDSTQRPFRGSYAALFQWVHSLHDWWTPWWSDKPITDRLFLDQERETIHAFLGEKTFSMYRLPAHNPQARMVAKTARKAILRPSALVDGNGLSYLRQWVNTISNRASWDPSHPRPKDRLGWVNHRLSLRSPSALAKRGIPLEPSFMPARGFLLVGPVDTGKAYLAKSLAAEGQMPLVRIVLRITQLSANVRKPEAANSIGQLGWIRPEGEGTRQLLDWTTRIAASLDLARRLAPALVWISDLDMFCSKLASDDLSLSLLILLLKHLSINYLPDLRRGIGLVGSSVRPTALDPRLVSLEALTHVVYIRKPTCSERQSHLLGLLGRKQLVLKGIKPDALQALAQHTVEYSVRELVAISEEVHTIAIARSAGRRIDAATLSLALSRRVLEVHPVIESTTRASCTGMLLYKVGRAMVQRMLAFSNSMQAMFADQEVWDTSFYYLTKAHLESSDLISSLTEVTVWPHILALLAGTAARDVLSQTFEASLLQRDNLALDRRASHDLGVAASLLQAFWIEFAGSDFCHPTAPQGHEVLRPRLARPLRSEGVYDAALSGLAPLENDSNESETRQESLSSSQTTFGFLKSEFEMRCSETRWRLGLRRSTVFDWDQAPDKPRFSSVVLPSYQGSSSAMPWETQSAEIYYDKSQIDQQEGRMFQTNLNQVLKQQRMKLMGLPITSQYVMEYEIAQAEGVWLGEKIIWNPYGLERLGSRGVLVRDLLVTKHIGKALFSIYGAKTFGPRRPAKEGPVEPVNEGRLGTGSGAVQRLAVKPQGHEVLRFASFLDLIEEVSVLSSPQVLQLEDLEKDLDLDRGLPTQGPHDIMRRFEFLRDRAKSAPQGAPSNDSFVRHTLLEGYFYLFHFFRSHRLLLIETVQWLARKGILT